MGRTAPPARVLVEAELARLRRLARALRDPRDRRALERALERVYRVLEAYKYEPMSDPLEPLLILALVECYKHLEQGHPGQAPPAQGPSPDAARGGDNPGHRPQAHAPQVEPTRPRSATGVSVEDRYRLEPQAPPGPVRDHDPPRVHLEPARAPREVGDHNKRHTPRAPPAPSGRDAEH